MTLPNPHLLPILESRVDWITATAEAGARGKSLAILGRDLFLQQEADGDKAINFRFQGFSGAQTSNVRYGERDGEGIVILTGEVAQANAVDLARYADHWSRVDYCVTVRSSDPEFDPVEAYWDTLKARVKRIPPTTNYSRIQDSDGGASISLGQRVSAFYTRVYNKTAESPGEWPAGCWRFETEFKRHASELERKHWASERLADDEIRAKIAHEIERHHLPVPFAKGARVTREPAPSHKFDADRSLDWLETQVRPCVWRVMEKRGRDAVLLRLGFRPDGNLANKETRE